MKHYAEKALKRDQLKALAIGAHYYKAIFTDTEAGESYLIGNYAKKGEAAEACRLFAKIELEQIRAGELVIQTREKRLDPDGKTRGHVVGKSENKALTFYQVK